MAYFDFPFYRLLQSCVLTWLDLRVQIFCKVCSPYDPIRISKLFAVLRLVLHVPNYDLIGDHNLKVHRQECYIGQQKRVAC
jgi:hypothetical protein